MSKIEETLKERGKNYGSYSDNVRARAIIMKELNKLHLLAHGVDMNDEDYVMLNDQVIKLVRLGVTPRHADSWIDIQGYAKISAGYKEEQYITYTESDMTMEEYNRLARKLIEQGRKDNPYYPILRKLLGEEFEEVTKESYQELIKHLAHRSILDIGCGDGSYINSLVGISTKLYACDKDEPSELNKNIDFRAIDFIKDSISTKYRDIPEVDLTIINEVIHVLGEGDIIELLSDLKNVTKQVLIGENYFEPELDYRLRNLSNGRLYDMADIFNMMREAGLTVKAVTEIGPRFFILGEYND